MTDRSHRLAFVVPTKDRPDDLQRLLESLETQPVHPDQLVIVDGSDDSIDHIVKRFPSLEIDYVRVYPPSLAKQRNAGMAQLRDDITHAGYLDDDIVFEEGAMEAMVAFWEHADDDVGGARFNIIDEAHPHLVPLKRIFGLDAPQRGKVLRSGFQTAICKTDETFEVDWLSGGATVWRRDVVETYEYDEWFQGTGYLEDVDYSYRVGKDHRLFVVADAEVRHLMHPVRKDRLEHLGRWEAVNRMYFTRKHPELSELFCYWGMIGTTVLNLARSLVLLDDGYLLRAKGNLSGLTTLLTDGIQQQGGHLK